MTTWRREIQNEMDELFETWDDVESCTLTDEQLDHEFEDALESCCASMEFNLWTKRCVYFPIRDGYYYCVGSAPRNPCDEPPEMIV